jgi:hypothetical protein
MEQQGENAIAAAGQGSACFQKMQKAIGVRINSPALPIAIGKPTELRKLILRRCLIISNFAFGT